MTKSIDAAVAAGIPVVTFDADAPGSKRIAYIGTNNKDLASRSASNCCNSGRTAANTPSSPAAPAPKILPNASMVSAKL